jgi:general secretion pathway protein F
MVTYFFKAVAADGKPRSGRLTAADEKAVARELRRQGLVPVYIGTGEKKRFEIKLPSFGSGTRRDVLYFTQELSTLLNAGVPVDRALSITADLTGRPHFRGVLGDVIRVLKGGKSLADSLATHPAHFSELYVNMVRAGEASGSLAVVFERLAEFERTRDDLRNYIISSMIYPGLLATVGLGSIIILMYFVVPRFAGVFEDSHLQMPLPTKIMLEVSNFLRAYGPFLGGGLVAAAVAFRAYIGTLAGRLWWDTFRLKIPILGAALLKAETARFARAMSTLVANSVPLVQSIGIARAILNNRRVAGSLDAVATGVKRGEGIAGPVRKVGVFPPLAAHLLSVGEETGKLDEMFGRMADVYEAETRTSIKRFTSLLEPLVILLMGIVVGALILSILVAITSINEVSL